ncbi:MAG: amino acid adenylation domain-containing protein, partial [Cytophagales bacterium]|nr:amino acid adenylation domain-containing protein [Cytophagales bacterium]
ARLKAAVLASGRLEESGPVEDVYPLSDIEKGMIFHSLKDENLALYHDQFLYQVSYPAFDVARFRKALGLLVRKHDMLRSAFNLGDFEEPLHIVYQEGEPHFGYHDISGCTKDEQEAFIKNHIAGDRKTKFDFARPSLFRMTLFGLGNDNLAALCVFHHAILDGWSLASLLTELNNAYVQMGYDAHFTPGSLKCTHRDFIKLHLAEKEKSIIRDYWRDELRDSKRMNLTGLSQGKNQNLESYRENLGADLLGQLSGTAKALGTSVKHLCFGAYAFVLRLLTYEDDLVTGMVTSNRPPLEDGDKILGCFLNTTPVRIRFPEGESWKDYAQAVHRKLVAQKAYEGLSLAEIMTIAGTRSGDTNPFFDTLFNYIDFHIYRQAVGETASTPDSRLRISNYENTNTLFDFIVDVTQQDLRILINYSRSLVGGELVADLAGYFRTVLTLLVEAPDAVASKSALLGKEAGRLVVANPAGYPRGETLVSRFEHQAAQTPDRTAVTFESQSFSYRQLNGRANQLAAYLRERTAGGAIIALLLEPSREMAVAMLGVLKAGAGYLPIDPLLPPARIDFMLRDSDAAMLLVQENTQVPAGFTGLVVVVTDPAIDACSAADFPVKPGPTDLAYVIYTSGTTGVPKGAMIEHRNVVRLFFNDGPLFDFSESDVWTMFHSYGFDFSVWEFYGAILFGGTVILIPRTLARDPAAYADLLRREGVTILNQTPSAFYNLQEQVEGLGLSDLVVRKVIFGGEALRTAKLRPWKARYPSCQLINMYGITETTVHVTYKEISEAHIREGDKSIGGPIPTLEVYVLDKHLGLLPRGVAGELCIGGAGLSRGYLNRPELTAQKFVANPFRAGERLYRSGDEGHVLPNGEISYQGRLDHQVQLHGFRIELGEIENCLLKYEPVKGAVAMLREAESGDQYLCAYLVAEREMAAGELRVHLGQYVPGYMIPSYYVFLGSLPVTANGKIDKGALPDPTGLARGRSGQGLPLPPRSKVEAQLVEIWQSVLKKEPLGVRDNFFNVGGDSIKAISLISKINAALASGLTIADLYSNETIEQLALKIYEDQATASGEALAEAGSAIEALRRSILASGKLPG